MERKQYLELCQKNAVGQLEKVLYKGVEYLPVAYELSFDKSGASVHTAILKDKNANSLNYCELKEVFENENKS